MSLDWGAYSHTYANVHSMWLPFIKWARYHYCCFFWQFSSSYIIHWHASLTAFLTSDTKYFAKNLKTKKMLLIALHFFSVLFIEDDLFDILLCKSLGFFSLTTMCRSLLCCICVVSSQFYLLFLNQAHPRIPNYWFEINSKSKSIQTLSGRVKLAEINGACISIKCVQLDTRKEKRGERNLTKKQ